MQENPKILALDFDGVLCDGLFEYFESASRTYCQVWLDQDSMSLKSFAERFYRLRPVVETGWEMPLLLRALVKGFAEAEILDQWPKISVQLVQEEQLDPKVLSAQLDGIRDRWIAHDVNDWFSHHQFYPGVIRRLSMLLDGSVVAVIVTTKTSRFVHQLLSREGLHWPSERVFGKETQLPKYEILRRLQGEFAGSLWFLEDRLQTLRLVQAQADLQDVGLFLADWGYNTAKERSQCLEPGDARLDQAQPIRLLSLAQFSQDFSAWL